MIVSGKPTTIKDDSSGRQKAELMLLADFKKRFTPPHDTDHAVLWLQSRDVQLGNTVKGYQDYDMCDGETNLNFASCALRSTASSGRATTWNTWP